MADPSQLALRLASLCYGGVASAAHMRAVLALRRAAAGQDVSLTLDFGGGEALVSRGRAGAVAAFLAGPSTHLMLTDGGAVFELKAVLEAVRSAAPLTRLPGGSLIVSKAAARHLSRAHPELLAGLGDVRSSAGRLEAVMLFESTIGHDGKPLDDLDAFYARWSALPLASPEAGDGVRQS